MDSIHCTHCGDEASQRCAVCKAVRYCSEECQTADWDWHKLLCKHPSSFIDKPTGDKGVRRVILLPEGGEKPIFYWMPVEEEAGDNSDLDEDDIDFISDLGVPERDAKSGTILPGNDEGSGMEDIPQYVSLVVGKMGQGDLLDHSIWMMAKECAMHLPPNKCLAGILGYEIANLFRGSVTFVRMTKVEWSSHTFDIDASDWTLALDGLIEYSKKKADSLKYFANGGRQPKKVRGVKVNQAMPFFEEVKVLRTSSVFADVGQLSALSTRLGLPFRTTTLHSGDAGQVTLDVSDNAPTLSASYMHISVDPTSPDFGTIPTNIQNDTSSALIVDTNKAAVSISTIVALCDFIKDVAQPHLAKASLSSQEERQAAVDAVAMMWQQRYDDAEEEGGEDAEDEETDEEEFYDAGAYDDLADVRAKMGRMQMTTADARTGAGYI